MHSKQNSPFRLNSNRLIHAGLLFILLAAASLASPPPVKAQTVPITITIPYLWQIGDLDLTTLGDFYARITINGVVETSPTKDYTNPFEGYIRPTGNLLDDTWVVVVNVPDPGPTVQMFIEIVDDDFPDPNDEADIDPGTGEGLDLTLDLATGTWTGDINWPQSCVSGGDDLDSESVGICFDINTVSAGGDLDGDGVQDSWEQKGVNLDGDEDIDIDLPAMGGNPFRKDIYVEVDCLEAINHSHCPMIGAIDDAVLAFARAPVANLDGTTGVQLHVDVGYLFGQFTNYNVTGAGGAVGTYGDFGGGGNKIAEAGLEIIESFSQPKGNGVAFDVIKDDWFDENREPIFHYAVFGHQTNYRSATNDCTSGEARGIPSNDFMVTLGGSPVGVPTFTCFGPDTNGLSVGYRNEQAGAFMHEIGHTLGLRHGGYQSFPENKPTYLSAMNYALWDCSIIPSPTGAVPGGCDYSRYELLAHNVPIDETKLDECVGLGLITGYGPINWDNDGLLEGPTNCQPPNTNFVEKDLNGDGIKTLLGGYDDWSNLDYISGISGAGDTNGVENEPDPQTIEDAKDLMGELFAPGVIVEKTGPATAVPGDVLDYTVEINNGGPGPALEAVLTDTAPDGSSQVYDLGAILVGGSHTQDSSFTVPADACPGDYSEAIATLDYKDIVGHSLSVDGTAPLEILDVSAPVLHLSVTPDYLWPPLHKFSEVTVTITVEDNCDTDPAISLVSIESNEPEANFIGNGDKGPDVEDAELDSDDRIFSLRAERGTANHATGRIYTITYEATDTSGNTGEAIVTVLVPISFFQIH